MPAGTRPFPSDFRLNNPTQKLILPFLTQDEAFPSSRFMIPARRLLALASASVILVSCQNGQNPFKKSRGGNDPYVMNYPSDGGYNPYPDQPGRLSGSAPSYETPVAPAEADPYAFNGASHTPPKTTTTSSSSSTSRKTVVSSTSKPKSSTSRTAAKKSTGSSSHTVTRGDSLYAIALKNKTTVAKIKSLNGLKSDLIRPGQRLKVR
jgi:LysM repeat protein